MEDTPHRRHREGGGSREAEGRERGRGGECERRGTGGRRGSGFRGGGVRERRWRGGACKKGGQILVIWWYFECVVE